MIGAFAPASKTVSIVKGWLIDSGIDAASIVQSDNKGWLAFSAPAGQVERILDAQYYSYQDQSTGERTIACSQYHVPAAVQAHIDYIVPGVIMKARPALSSAAKKHMHRRRSRTIAKKKHEYPPNHGPDSSCGTMTPKCIADLYGIPPAASTVNPTNSLGIYEWQSTYDQRSMDAFFYEYSPQIPAGTHPDNTPIDGGSSGMQVEANLDLTVSYPIIYPQNIIIYATNEDSSNIAVDPLLEAIDGVCCELYHIFQGRN